MTFLEKIAGEIDEWSMSTLFTPSEINGIGLFKNMEVNCQVEVQVNIPSFSCDCHEQYSQRLESLNAALSRLEETLLPVAYDTKIEVEELACLGLSPLPQLQIMRRLSSKAQNFTSELIKCIDLDTSQSSSSLLSSSEVLVGGSKLLASSNTLFACNPALSSLTLPKKQTFNADFSRLLVKRRKERLALVISSQEEYLKYVPLDSEPPTPYSPPPFVPLPSYIPFSSSRTPILASPFLPAEVQHKKYMPSLLRSIKTKFTSNYEKFKNCLFLKSSSNKKPNKSWPRHEIRTGHL